MGANGCILYCLKTRVRYLTNLNKYSILILKKKETFSHNFSKNYFIYKNDEKRSTF